MRQLLTAWSQRMFGTSTMSSAHAVPLVRQIRAEAAKVLCSKSPTWADASPLAALVDQVTLADVGLQSPTEGPASGFGSLFGHGPSTPYEGKIKFIQISSYREFEIVVIVLPAGTRIPLHDHPGMLVFSRLLCGEMHVRAFDVQLDGTVPSSLTATDRPISGYGIPAMSGAGFEDNQTVPAALVHDKVFVGPATLTLLPEEGGNVHAFEAVTPCAVFDVLAPPYDWNVQRGCQYFTELGPNPAAAVAAAATGGLDHLLLTCEAPWDFETSRWPYTGPLLD